ncbi:MAG: polyphosphate kinase 2 family protein [Phycisphaerales bacterium JB059]
MDVTKEFRVEPGKKVDLKDWDPGETLDMDRDEAEERLEENARVIGKLQHRLYAEHKRSLLVVLQAMDAAGKDSTVRHVLREVNPQGVLVTSFKKPTSHELARDFLWRIHRRTPRRGHIRVFNRSHYEDVLVVRVENLVPESVWKKRYEAINDFERMIHESGTEIIKIYLNISKDRQREKLMRRLTDPDRAWKFEAADFETRKKWDDYMEAYEDAITRCNTEHAPWFIVPTDKKWFRLYVISQIIRDTLERMDPKLPPLKIEPAAAMRLLDGID